MELLVQISRSYNAMPVSFCGDSSGGGTTERIYVHIGEIDASAIKPGSVHGLSSENEDIRVHVLSREQAYQWMELGVIDNAATVIAIQWLQLNHLG